MRKGNWKSNPFKGAYPLEIGDPIFGRERELSELFQLLVAQRILLLHAQSGAGKTSLIQAGLIPELEKEDFHVLSIGRVIHERAKMPAGNDGFNRYISGLIHSLEDNRSQVEEVLSDQDLSGLSLTQYLNSVVGGEEPRQPMVLIVDQFEEVFRDPLDTAEKKDFFYLLGKALRNPYLWALFVIRDDYMGALRDKKFLRPIPTQLGNTYHLNLLDVDAAARAIRGTADVGGRRFTEKALTELLKDLCRIRVKRRDGETREEEGTYVEPVQLQVVCEQLWRKLPSETKTITVTELEEFGDVDDSLGDFYDQTVARVASENKVGERSIRNWFERGLITANDLRTQVMDDGNLPLDDQVIEDLIKAHLVRGEDRRGITWYELAHDRLVRPVQERNRFWYEKNLSLLQRRSEVWKKTPDNDLLLQGEQVWEAERWAKGRPLKDYEKRFLRASVLRERARARARWKRWFAIAVVLVLLVFTTIEWRRAERATKRAEEAEAAAIGQKEIAQDEADRAEAEADRADQAAREAEANLIRAEIQEGIANANAKLAKSLRLADRAESYLEAGNTQAALLIGREAITVTETTPAMRVVRDTFARIGYESPPEDGEALAKLVCEQVGRNLTLREWRETFADESYQRTCPMYGTHISYVEEALLACEDIAEARRRYQEAEKDGLPPDFDNWAAPLLLEEAAHEADASHARACLQKAQETGLLFDRVAFMRLKRRLAGLTRDFSSDPSAQRVLQEVETLDKQRREWPPIVATAFDESLSAYYRELCTNLSSLDDAKRACTALNQILQRNLALSHIVPMTRTATTGTLQTYNFHAKFGDLVTIGMDVRGEAGKPNLTLRDANDSIIRSQDAEEGALSEVVLPATGNYFLDLAWEEAPPTHSLLLTRTEPERIFAGSTVDAPASGRIWQFEGSAGDLVTIVMDAQGKGDPLLTLRDEEGELIAQNDDFGETRNSRVQAQLPADGKYFIEAGWYGNSSPVPYRLALSRVESLVLGDTVVGAARQKEWVFEGNRGDFVTIAVEALDENAVPQLRLLDQSGSVIRASGDGMGGEAILNTVRLPYDGVYSISTEWVGESSNYQVSLSSVEPAQLELGDTVRGASAEQLWAFDGQSGDIVSIAMEAGDEQGAPLFRLSDESGNVIGSAESGDGHIASICGIWLSRDGRYLVETDWIASPGNYTLSITRTDTGMLEYGDTAEGMGSEQCVWQFEGSQGDFVTITMDALGPNGDPLLTLLDEEGAEIAFDDDGGSDLNARLELTLPDDGLYLINAGWVDTPGLYSLSLTETEPEPLAVGATVENARPEQFVWQFEGSQGDFLTIAMDAQDPEGNPLLTLLDETGEVVELNDDGGAGLNALLHAILPEDGSYIIDAGWVSQPVSYTLSLEQVEATLLNLPTAVQEANPGQWAWRFEGERGDNVTIAMDALEEGGDPLLRLYDENGQVVDENDDRNGKDALMRLTLPESGIYFIDAAWFSDPGRYRLTLRQTEAEVDLESVATMSRESALLLIETGYVEEGLALFEQVEVMEASLPTTLLLARDYNRVCRFGSLWGYAAEVMFACEVAVKLEPENGAFADSRGVARALTGDFEGAVEDFQTFLDWGFGRNNDWRQEWIAELEAGHNPFEDEALLEQLRNE